MLDVLAFYQERLANESFLRTATERRSILELARLIGYQPSPGVAASTWLAFTLQEAPGLPGQPPVAAPGADRARACRASPVPARIRRHSRRSARSRRGLVMERAARRDRPGVAAAPGRHRTPSVRRRDRPVAGRCAADRRAASAWPMRRPSDGSARHRRRRRRSRTRDHARDVGRRPARAARGRPARLRDAPARLALRLQRTGPPADGPDGTQLERARERQRAPA